MNAAQQHWDAVYRDKVDAQTSWFRGHLGTSLRLIDELRLPAPTPVIDIGGGRATLVDDLLARGYTDVTVLDLAESALAASYARLGADAAHVDWCVADIVEVDLQQARYALWHDRAVFHFLVDATARARYVAQATRAVRAGGYVIIATFAPDGPERCSGLPVQRYDADALAAAFAPAFARVGATREEHRTPWDSVQPFTYVVLQCLQPAASRA